MKGELQSLWFAEDQAWEAYKPKVVDLGKETGVELINRQNELQK